VEGFGHLGIPRVVHRGELSRGFVADVRAGRFGTPEGVILEGGEGHPRWMAKVKTTAYLRRLKAFFEGGWPKHWEGPRPPGRPARPGITDPRSPAATCGSGRWAARR